MDYTVKKGGLRKVVGRFGDEPDRLCCPSVVALVNLDL